MTEAHMNFMGGNSYELFNPIRRLMMPLLSGFLGQPSYYMPTNEEKTNSHDEVITTILKEHLILPKYCGLSRQKVFYDATIEALDYDFGETLKLAVRARNEWLMRKSPAQLLAIAASHSKRVEFNEQNPKEFRRVVMACCPLPGDMISILDSWKALHGSKANFPSVLKRAFEDRLREITPYHCGKYSKQIIDITRISHPSRKSMASTSIETLLTNGTVELDDEDITWEKHRSQGKSWTETLAAMGGKMPHMAALRNICGVARSDPGEEFMQEYCDMVLSGVKGGKQFPFRYISAYDTAKRQLERPQEEEEEGKRGNKPIDAKYAPIILDCLEKCLQTSIENYPKLDGSVVVLSDNSGSAHGTFTSTYGRTTVSDIGNLSALFTALSCTGRGVVAVFGDNIIEYEVNKTKPILEQYEEIRKLGEKVGACTENGVWLFFKKAFAKPEDYKFDYWFCYSDMQVGHGELFGNDVEITNGDWNWGCKYAGTESTYIDVHKLVTEYRKTINPRLNTFMVQTAGYIDSALPESTYRGAILSGWTGNEVKYAKEITRLWDEIEEL